MVADRVARRADRSAARTVARRRDQRGETLLESLLSISILALVALSAFGGLQTAIKLSAHHRDSAVAETLLRSAAERLQDPSSPYVPRAGCPGAGTYTGLPTKAGYPPITVTVSFWLPPAPTDPPPWPTTFAAKGSPQDCPAQDPGLQQISMTLNTPSGLTEHLDILKRSN